MKINQRGETLISFLAAVLISSIVLAGAVNGLFSFSTKSVDAKLISEANDKARFISDLMSYELRFAGSGVPFQQANFLMSTAGIGTSSLPILTTSTATSITFKANPQGRVGYLMTSFNSANQTTLNLVSSSSFSVGDTIYLSDMAEGGSNGMQATVQSISGNAITISSPVQAVTAIYPAGTIVEPVQSITYTSNGSAITRAIGNQAAVTLTGGAFSIQYLDSTGAAMALPLTTATMGTSLYSLSLTIGVPSTRTLSSGSTYYSTLTSRVALRVLNVYR